MPLNGSLADEYTGDLNASTQRSGPHATESVPRMMSWPSSSSNMDAERSSSSMTDAAHDASTNAHSSAFNTAEQMLESSSSSMTAAQGEAVEEVTQLLDEHAAVVPAWSSSSSGNAGLGTNTKLVCSIHCIMVSDDGGANLDAGVVRADRRTGDKKNGVPNAFCCLAEA